MKCPHCGMNIRDNIVICGYCGGKIAKEPEKSPSGAGRPDISTGSTGQKGTGAKITTPLQEEPETDEEEGGISVYLQPDEQVLIGSLNIAVKKFFFHAYLTNHRIFLIDTQEKKVKVTAKDIPRDTIAGSIIEYSESSDPVLVLSLKSADDEIKTMKLIFIQNGMDRSDEIDEWISLLQEQEQKKTPAQTIEELPEHREEPAPVQPEKPLQKQELQPKRKPGKDHEKQQPVKRHISFHKMQEQEPEVEELPRSPRRAQVREVPEQLKKPVTKQESDSEFSPVRKADTPPVRKYEVQSAMKSAMKSAMQPLKSPSPQTAKRPVMEPVSPPFKEFEPEETEGSSRRPPIQEKAQETPAQDDGAEIPPFCQNCGKKIPPAANFCPGCGTKLGTHRAVSPDSAHEKKAIHHEAPVREKKRSLSEEDIGEDERDDETPIPTKPPVKKAPKGSEMTILHKFLRR